MRVSRLLLATTTLIWAPPAFAQSEYQLDQQLQNPANDAVRSLTNLVFEAGGEHYKVQDAARQCNTEALAASIARLEQLQKQTQDAESGAKAAGKYAEVNPAVAHRAYDLVSRELDQALSAQKLCPPVKGVDQPTLRPTEVYTPQQTANPPPAAPGGDVPTNVDKPTLPPTEVFTPKPPPAPATGAQVVSAPAPRATTPEQLRAAVDACKRSSGAANSPFSRAIASRVGVGCPSDTDLGANLSPFDQRILDMQNAERTALGLQPFQWNPVLAQHAQDYANQLAQTGQLAHSSREGRGIERENLNQGMLGWGPDQMLQNWLNEKQHLVPGTFPNVSDTGNWLDVGHITQILWPTTTDVGCGDATGSGFQWLVCRYSPGGNKDGVGVGFAAAGGVGPATAITGVALAAGSAPPVAGANAKPPDANGLGGPVNVRIDDSWGSYRGPAVQRPTPTPPVIHIGRDTPTFPAGPGSSYARNATNYVPNTPNYNYGYRRGQNAAYGVLSDAVIGGLTTLGSQPQKPAESGNHPAVTPPKIDLVKDITPEPVSTPPSPIANNDDRMNQMAANSGSPTHLWSGLNTDAAVSDPLGHLHRRSAIAYFDVSANAWCLGAFICGGGAYSSGYIGNWNNAVVFPSMGIPSEPAGSGGAMIFGFTGNTAYPSVTMTVGDSSAPSSIPVILAGQDVLDDFIMNIPGTAAIGVSPTITIDTNVLPPDLPGMEFSQPQPERPELEKM